MIARFEMNSDIEIHVLTLVFKIDNWTRSDPDPAFDRSSILGRGLDPIALRSEWLSPLWKMTSTPDIDTCCMLKPGAQSLSSFKSRYKPHVHNYHAKRICWTTLKRSFKYRYSEIMAICLHTEKQQRCTTVGLHIEQRNVPKVRLNR